LGGASPPPVVRDDGSDSGARSASETGISQIGNWVSMNANKIASSISDQYTANSDVSKKQIASLAKEANAFEARSRERFDKYESLAKDLIGDDPNAERLFWYTVSAAIMKPGNAFANMAQGFKEATIAANTSREKKNKLLMQLSKDEMEFERDIDKLKSASTIQGINLTAKQEIALNKQPQAIRDEVMKFLLAGYKYNVAVAKARKELNAGEKDKSFGSLLKQGEGQIGKDYGFIIDKDGNLGAGKGSPTLDSPLYQQMLKRQAQFRKLYTDKLDALESTSYDAQLEAYRYATDKTTPKTAISGSGVDRKNKFATVKDAKRVVEADKNNYLGKTIQVGGTKYKVTAAGFEKVRR
jgi:hypothetical protein